MGKPAERALVVTVLVVLLAVAGCGSDSRTDSSTSTSGSTTSTTVPSSGRPATAIWPFGDSTTRYPEPEQAAEGFAVDYLGFVDPVVGTFTAGDSRSGEVTVRPNGAGPVTTVAVEQDPSDDTWWVLVATTPNLQLEVPAANVSITSPVTLSGRSTAFEGSVTVEVHQDGTVTPVVTDFVTGGANEELAPFSKTISFDPPTATTGAIVLETAGGENGTTLEASVVRVKFG